MEHPTTHFPHVLQTYRAMDKKMIGKYLTYTPKFSIYLTYTPFFFNISNLHPLKSEAIPSLISCIFTCIYVICLAYSCPIFAH
jgi:hypothetical protein